MSLIRQMWGAALIVLALALSGSFVISTMSARDYFAQQLYLKNVDNAASLALTMSQMDKDAVTLELLLSAQFDAGHYRLIRLIDPLGKLIIEHRDEQPVLGVPQFFINAIPITVAPGLAQVQDGWKQFGTLTVQSHDRYAYIELWHGARILFGWLLITAMVTGLGGTVLLRMILRPLDDVVTQAEAIGARRFVTNTEPYTLEFRRLVRSMNTLSGRVRQMVEEESGRVEALRRRAQIDPLTGLLNRESFVSLLDATLAKEDAASSGVVVILRLSHLAALNLSLGREAADQLLRRVGEQLQASSARRAKPWTTARIGGADFAVLAPGEADAVAIAGNLVAAAHLALDAPDASGAVQLAIGTGTYHHAESRAAVLSRIDGALAESERTAGAVVQAGGSESGAAGLPTDARAWRAALDQALADPGVRLGRYPVMASSGDLLHSESPVRLQIGGEWQVAGRFIAWVSRLGLMPRLDALVVEAALAEVARSGAALSVNLSAEAVCDAQFQENLVSRLASAGEAAAALWFEVPEHDALHHMPEYRALCLALKPFKCRVGLKHAGTQFARLGEFHDIGLDYLKIDASLIRGIDANVGGQVFLRGVCTVAHSIGLIAIAEGVRSDAERLALADVGMDGMTGPAIKL